MSRGTLSRNLSVWLSWILGGVSILVGMVMIFTAFTAWGPIKTGLARISEGLYSAESAIELFGSDFGSSSSLVVEVSNSIRGTADVVYETWLTLQEIMETTEEVRDMTTQVRMSIDQLPRSITSILGGNHFSDVVVSLNRTYNTSGEALLQMEHLASTLGPIEHLLMDVADGVDSLAVDLFSTEEAFSEASGHLNRAAAAIEATADSSFLPVVIAVTGLIPLLVGLYLIIQGLALRKLYFETPARSETPE